MERVNATHMIVSWTALSLVEARGHIIYYTVNYWPSSYSEDIKSINVPHNITRVEISDLLYGETYTVQVSASTSVGPGIVSVELSSTKPPSTPYSMLNFSLHVCKLDIVSSGGSDGDNTAAIVGGGLGAVTVLAIMAVMIVVVLLVRNCGVSHLTGMKNKYVKALL